ncbi:type VI secretion system protein ImpA [Planctomycetales bacterium]|nr:type VI secretion system protein ImpA [Planctomycetales bacterium]GHT01581.1 type VI secretion system protein ImpA [Planctomycetales bacterium]GHT08889.1 type VI secretion system protein ImpA [Planctomycetales bacterium]
MSELDFSAFCAPLVGDKPAGENLEYDAKFLAVAAIAVGKPQQVMGDAVIDAEPPDWRALRDACLALAPRTRDLRLAVYLALAELQIDGLAGYAAGLAVVGDYVDNLWDHFYPTPDPDDPTDLVERLNTFAALSAAPGAFDDSLNFAGNLRDAVLLQSRAVGKVTLRDLLAVAGEIPPSAAGAPDETLINAVFMDVGADAVATLRDTLFRARDTFDHIGKILADKAGNNPVPDLSVVANLLKKTAQQVDRRWREMTGADAEVDAEAVEVGDTGGGAGKIRNRGDVARTLKKMIAYYDGCEPGSPVPFLLKRALKMVDMNFVALMSELSPDSIERLSVVMGKEILPAETNG